VEADQVQARSRSQGGEALHKFQQRYHHVRGAAAVGAFQLQHDIARAIALEPFVGDRVRGGAGLAFCVGSGKRQDLIPFPRYS